MKRLCIFSIYDAEGIVDEYIYYWLKEFRTVCGCIIVVSNGRLQRGHRLSNYADQILERANTGFDGGAYADVLTNHLSYESIQSFDEVILCNDTCYGPFVPMRNIFDEMDSRKNDFWGIQLWDEGYAKWINSFFLVFRKKVIMDRAWYMYFKNRIDQKAASMAEAYGNYEMGLYLWMTVNDYRPDYYAVPSDNHCMKCPDYFIEACCFPFMKKRSFCQEHYHEENLRKALALIRRTGYDLNWIIGSIRRRYEISNQIKAMAESDEADALYLKQETMQYSVDRSVKTPEEIRKFIHKNNEKNMYIYGAGAFGSRIFQVYRSCMENFKGFVVTRKSTDRIFKEKVYQVNEISLDNSAIILGMDKRNTDEVIKYNFYDKKYMLNLYEP